MPPRRTADASALFAALVEDLRIQIAASLDQSVSDIHRRLTRLERRIEQLDPSANATGRGHHGSAAHANRKACALCERVAVARRLCSAHYQQWRYRERKGAIDDQKSGDNRDMQNTILLAAQNAGMSKDN